MNRERGDIFANPNFQQPTSEYEQLSEIQLQQIDESDESYATALEVYNPGGELSQEEIEQRARGMLEFTSWWLQPYWQEKGLPKQQVTIEIGDAKLDIFNYSNPISNEQIETTQRVLSLLSQIKDGLILKDIKHLLIDDNEKLDVKSGNPRNGITQRHTKAIQLYPNALKPIEHRIPGVSNFEGTLIHEYGHVLQDQSEFIEQWRRNHKWRLLPEEEQKNIDDHTHMWVNDQPDRCPSEYARFNASEDVCESLVAAIKNPEILDPERLETLRQSWLKDLDNKATAKAKISDKRESEIELPTTSQPVKYKVKVGGKIKFTEN